MQPAVDTDLRAMRESLVRLIADEELPAATEAVLGEVMRSLKRLERSWAKVLPYLVAENAGTSALLADLAPLLPGELQAEIAVAGPPAAPVGDLTQFDAVRANESNGVLRDLLARAIVALPAGEPGAQARARTQEHLQRTLELRPW